MLDVGESLAQMSQDAPRTVIIVGSLELVTASRF